VEFDLELFSAFLEKRNLNNSDTPCVRCGLKGQISPVSLIKNENQGCLTRTEVFLLGIKFAISIGLDGECDGVAEMSAQNMDVFAKCTPDYQGTGSRQCHPAQDSHAEQRCQLKVGPGTSRPVGSGSRFMWNIAQRLLGIGYIRDNALSASCQCSALPAFLLQSSLTTILSGSNFKVFLEAAIHHVDHAHISGWHRRGQRRSSHGHQSRVWNNIHARCNASYWLSPSQEGDNNLRHVYSCRCGEPQCLLVAP
jgi:hypothetical protein